MYLKLDRKIPSYYLIFSTIVGVLIAFVLLRIVNSQGSPNYTSTPTTTTDNCEYNIARLEGYQYVRPLLFAEEACESPKLIPLKLDISNIIDQAKSAGILIEASVLVRQYHTGHWTSINRDEAYHPGSLLKVPLMMAILKMAEVNPSLLKQEIHFTQHDPSLPVQEYKEQGLKPGKNYTVESLLHYLIAYSDNDASLLLFNIVDKNIYNKVFTDIGVAAPPAKFNDMKITAPQYSLFLKALYNASYLTISASEFATSLLAESNFKDGLVAGMPNTAKIAHKFGEWGDGQIVELHESGIVYSGHNSYLVTVMTRGKNFKDLANVISQISKATFEKLNADDTQ